MNQAAAFFDKMMSAAQAEFGKEGVYVASDHARTHYGIYLPSLAQQFLYTSNILPLERLCEFSGQKGSGKSALAYEMMRLFVEAGGIGTVIETENKTSAGLMQAVLGEENQKSVQFYRAKSVESAMDLMTWALHHYRTACESRHIPYLILWDSLVGSKAEETLSKIAADGHSSRQFPAEALIISNYFGTLPDRLIGLPIGFVYTNHEKDKPQEGPGRGPSTSNPGGHAPDFYNTYHVRVLCTRQADRKALYPYMNIRMQTKKNNMGLNGRRIDVSLHFRRDKREDDGEYGFDAVFDWDTATVDLLLSEDLPAKSRVKEIIHLVQQKKGVYNWTDKGLKGVPAAEICRELYADEERYKALQAALSIDTWTVFRPEDRLKAYEAETSSKSPKKKKKKKAAETPTSPPPPTAQSPDAESSSLFAEDPV